MIVSGSVDSIETFGLVDGPGIRTVVFLSGCKLRCKYCHNPEMWTRGVDNYSSYELARKILKDKNYFSRNGGVTFSGGEPLLQDKFVIEVAKLLKKYNIHIAIDTAGVGNGNYAELLKYVDLVILDIKHTTSDGYKDLTGMDIDESLKFREALNKSGKEVWIRQVVVPGNMDNKEYMNKLLDIVLKIKNVTKIEFLPYHKLGSEKYISLGIDNPYLNMPEMDVDECNKLYEKFMNKYNKIKSSK